MNVRTIKVSLASIALAGLLVAPTGQRHSASAASASAAPQFVRVSIVNYAFNPPILTVAPGTTVVWTNNDIVSHTVSADDGSWSSRFLAPHKYYSHTFKTAGTFGYHCKIHIFMTGTVVVS